MVVNWGNTEGWNKNWIPRTKRRSLSAIYVDWGINACVARTTIKATKWESSEPLEVLVTLHSANLLGNALKTLFSLPSMLWLAPADESSQELRPTKDGLGWEGGDYMDATLDNDEMNEAAADSQDGKSLDEEIGKGTLSLECGLLETWTNLMSARFVAVIQCFSCWVWKTRVWRVVTFFSFVVSSPKSRQTHGGQRGRCVRGAPDGVCGARK